MSSYKDMKDWQICQLVHNHVVCDGEFDVTFENYGCQWQFKDKSRSSETFEFTMNEAKARVKGYVSEIEHAWPIIVENKISIAFGSELTTARVFTCTNSFEVIDKNPLRAACICFLKMKDEEK
ncbi:putative NinX [Vibrio phage 242E40-1]|nr:putative NinX [Vibrio phage 242E40-1]